MESEKVLEIVREKLKGITNKDEIIEAIKILSENIRILCLKDNQINLDQYSKIKIIKTLSEEERIRCLTDDEIYLSSSSKTDIIRSLSYDNVIRCIRNEKIVLNTGEKISLIYGLKEEAQIDFLRENKDSLDVQDKIDIMQMLSEENTIKCLQDSAILDLYEKIKVIENFRNTRYTVALKNIEAFQADNIINEIIGVLRNDVDIESYKKVDIINFLPEEKRIEIIKDEKNKLNSYEKMGVILELSKDNVIQCLKDKILDKPEYIAIIILVCFNEGDMLKTDIELDDKITGNLMELLYNFGPIVEEKFENGDSKGLEIPSEMTIGMELESETLKSIRKYIMNKRKVCDWSVKEDGSLADEKDVELVSPILHNNAKDIGKIEHICNSMKRLGLYTTERCGLHIHVGADFFDGNEKAWEKFILIWNECEKIIYKMSNPPRQLPRKGILQYANGRHNEIENIYNSESQTDKDDKLKYMRYKLQGNRYVGLNLDNVGDEEKNTIEFRIFNGTLEPEVIKEDIKLCGSIMLAGFDLALIDDPTYFTPDEAKEKKKIYEKVLRRDITEEEKVDAFLSLIFDDEKTKNIFKTRWQSVKDEKIFDKIVLGPPTYSMKEQTQKFVSEIPVVDRKEFLDDVMKNMNKVSSKTVDEEKN